MFESVEKKDCEQEKERLVVWHKEKNKGCIIVHHRRMKFIDPFSVTLVEEKDKDKAPCGPTPDLYFAVSIMPHIGVPPSEKVPWYAKDLKREIEKSIPSIRWNKLSAHKETWYLNEILNRFEQIKEHIKEVIARHEPQQHYSRLSSFQSSHLGPSGLRNLKERFPHF